MSYININAQRTTLCGGSIQDRSASGINTGAGGQVAPLGASLAGRALHGVVRGGGVRLFFVYVFCFCCVFSRLNFANKHGGGYLATDRQLVYTEVSWSVPGCIIRLCFNNHCNSHSPTIKFLP